jgi:hypothetical protein
MCLFNPKRGGVNCLLKEFPKIKGTKSHIYVSEIQEGLLQIKVN